MHWRTDSSYSLAAVLSSYCSTAAVLLLQSTVGLVAVSVDVVWTGCHVPDLTVVVDLVVVAVVLFDIVVLLAVVQSSDDLGVKIRESANVHPTMVCHQVSRGL